MKLHIDVPQGLLPKLWRRWEKVEAVQLHQGEDGRVTLLVSYDLAETARTEFDELREAA